MLEEEKTCKTAGKVPDCPVNTKQKSVVNSQKMSLFFVLLFKLWIVKLKFL